MKKATAPAPKVSAVVTTTVSKTGGSFDPKNYAKNGLTVDVIQDLKKSFDLFDTDGGGSISMKGTNSLQLRALRLYVVSGIPR